jgi:dTDP-4-amino-4,6-dideoxygalactose transaminase
MANMAEAAIRTEAPEPMAFIDLQAQRRRIGDRINRAIGAVMEHGQYILGPEVKELENRLARHCAARHAVGCSSGTDALVLALMALEVGPGDAVLCPSFTFAATAEAVALVGATPVFVDIVAETCNLDADSVEAGVETVKNDPRLRAVGIIAVDLYGQPADYRRINAIADRHGLWVIADAAQSYGARLDNRRVGTLAKITTTSFFPAKPLGCYGDGGAVFTDDDELAERLRSLLFHGKGADKYDNVRIGMNGRLDTIQAAILIEKLAVFDDELSLRDRVADRYNIGLRDVVEVPAVIPGARPAWAQYTLWADNRDEVAAKLKHEGIPTAVYYPRPLHLQTAYRNFPVVAGGLPCSERMAKRVLSIPMHPYLEPSAQQRIVDAVRRAMA